MEEISVKIDIYSTTPCSYCKRAKDLLIEKGYEFEDHNLDNTTDRMRFKAENPGLKTVPQIFVTTDDDKTIHIGGYDELVHEFKKENPIL